MLSSAFGLALTGQVAFAQQAGQGSATPADPQAESRAREVPSVDPLTGRAVDRNPTRSGAVEQSLRDRYSDVQRDQQGNLNGTVQAYIPLPSISGANQGAMQVRTTDRALQQRVLPGVTVKERRRPEYDAVGFRTGGVRILPYALAGVAYDSNVYAETNGRDDYVVTGTVGAVVRSEWGRHQIELNGNVRRREYGRFDSENATTYRLLGKGRLDLSGRNALTVEASQEKLALDRAVADEVVSQAFPTKLRRSRVEVGSHIEQGVLEVDVAGRASREKYDDNASVGGAFVSQAFRNFDSLGGNVQLGLDVGGLRSLYGELDMERRRFDIQAGPIDRDANVYKAIGGVRGGVTKLIRGHIGVGYMSVDFRQAGAKSLGALALDAELDWLFSQRTTFSFQAKRDLRTVAQQNSRGTILTSLSAGVDHEVRYNIILSATLQQQWTNYIADTRRAEATRLSLGGTWLVDRHIQIRPQVTFQRRTMRGFDIDARPKGVFAGFDIGYRF